MQHGRRHFSTLCGSVRPSLFCLLLNSYFSHLFQLSVLQGLNLLSTWVKVPHWGHSSGFNIETSPLVPLIKLPTFPAFIMFQYLYFPPSVSATSCVHLVLISKLPPGAPQQLPAFIWLHMWHPRGLPAISCKHLVSIF